MLEFYQRGIWIMPKEKDTKIDKSSISNAITYEEIGEFWDENSLDAFWSDTEDVTFQVNLNLNNRLTYYGINENLSEQLSSIAKQKGISAKELLNSWIQEKLAQESA